MTRLILDKKRESSKSQLIINNFAHQRINLEPVDRTSFQMCSITNQVRQSHELPSTIAKNSIQSSIINETDSHQRRKVHGTLIQKTEKLMASNTGNRCIHISSAKEVVSMLDKDQMLLQHNESSIHQQIIEQIHYRNMSHQCLTLSLQSEQRSPSRRQNSFSTSGATSPSLQWDEVASIKAKQAVTTQTSRMQKGSIL